MLCVLQLFNFSRQTYALLPNISKEVGKVVLVVLHYFPQYFAATHILFLLCNAFFLVLFQTTDCARVNAAALRARTFLSLFNCVQLG